MIYTSYFAKLNKIKELNRDPNKPIFIPISICGKAPDWYDGLQYKKVAPKWGFFKEWKENHDNDFYIEHFQKEVLNPLMFQTVLSDLFNILDLETQKNLEKYNMPWFTNPNINIVLLCYEKPEDFCHRHLVADWLNQSGYRLNVKELDI